MGKSITNHALHSTWHHTIDSRFPDATAVKDEGIMTPTSLGRTSERGVMVNPATGVMTKYEELWRDITPIIIPSVSDIVVEDKTCMVLELRSEEHPEAQGMIVRVGQYCQGVMRVGEEFTAERWKWCDDRTGSGWKRQARIGDYWLPCGVAIGAEHVQDKKRVGTEVKFGEFLWIVVELSHF